MSELPAGALIYVDANIFLYHTQDASPQCSDFLTACERRIYQAVSSTETLIEVSHRAMLGEAIRKGLATPKNAVHRLKERPALLKELHEYRLHLKRAQNALSEVLSISADLFEMSLNLCASEGLLLRDALLLAALRRAGVENLATADRDFERVAGIKVYRPTDIR